MVMSMSPVPVAAKPETVKINIEPPTLKSTFDKDLNEHNKIKSEKVIFNELDSVHLSEYLDDMNKMEPGQIIDVVSDAENGKFTGTKITGNKHRRKSNNAKNKRKTSKLIHIVRLLINEDCVSYLTKRIKAKQIEEKTQASIWISEETVDSMFKLCYVEGGLCHIIQAVISICDELAENSLRSPPLHIVLTVIKNNSRLKGNFKNINQVMIHLCKLTGANLYCRKGGKQESRITIGGKRECVHSAICEIIKRLYTY